MGVWQFIQDQVFGMKWLNELIGKGLSKLGLDVRERIGGSIQFFFYDVLKITVLLCLLIFVISYIQSYFPPERSKRILSRFHGVGANIISALLGTVTPFCSCSSIPLFIGFTSAGLPLGVTFSFLISSPMVDLGSLILLMSIFGAKVAVIYVIVGLMIAVAGGTLIEKLHMEPYVEEFVRAAGGVDIEYSILFGSSTNSLHCYLVCRFSLILCRHHLGKGPGHGGGTSMKLKEAIKKAEESIEETLACCDFPSEHWARINIFPAPLFQREFNDGCKYSCRMRKAEREA